MQKRDRREYARQYYHKNKFRFKRKTYVNDGGLKVCRDCGLEKPASSFWKDMYIIGGLKHRCILCIQKDPRKDLSSRASNLKRWYGITLAEYDRLLVQQNYCCAICNIPQEKLSRRLDIDHNHKSGQVRGLLCSSCNTTLGKINEDIPTAESLVSYLKKWTLVTIQ